MSELVLEGIHKHYPGRPPVHAVRGLTHTVTSGSLTAVLGRSGCGKSTLLRCIAGFERLDGGRILLDGKVIADPKSHTAPERRNIGIVPQEGALFPHLSVAGNVAFGLRGRLGRAAIRARVDEVLEMVGLAGYGPRKPHALSGGQQQRVALARALAPTPTLVLLDEPFAALDAGLRSSLRQEVAEVLQRAGTTAILVTHDQGEALSTADQVVVMDEGRIVQTGSPLGLYRRPTSLLAAQILGEVNVVEAEIIPLPGGGEPDGATHSATTALGEVRVIGPGEDGHPGHGLGSRLLLRPEQLVRLEIDHDGVKATVGTVRFHGPDAMIELHVGELLLVARWPSTLVPSSGDVVGVGVLGPVAALGPAGG